MAIKNLAEEKRIELLSELGKKAIKFGTDSQVYENALQVYFTFVSSIYKIAGIKVENKDTNKPINKGVNQEKKDGESKDKKLKPISK